MVSADYHEQRLKRHADETVRKCIAENYHTGPMGYLIMVGGEALNFHLPEDKKVKTADFDLKFVVTPKFSDSEENLRKANVKRLYIARDLVECLKKLKPPAGYKKLEPRLTLLFNDIVHDVRLDGHRVYVTNPETGEERFTVYRFNKVFTIKLRYIPNDRKTESEFTLIDLGLYYRLPAEEPFYNFMTNTIYNTFLNPPFSRPIPVPFVIKDKIRFPILPYILVDNARMMLFAEDFLNLYKGNEKKIPFFESKLKGYQKKLNIILGEFSKREENKKLVEQIEKQISKVVKIYKPLAKKNIICYREEGRFNFTTVLQKKPGCDDKYLADLDDFFAEYHSMLKMINELMPEYRPRKRSKQRSKSRSKSKRSKSRSKKRSNSRN